MEKTLLQIAQELGVSKQRVYRYVKSNHITGVYHESDRRASTMWYNEAAQNAIKIALSVDKPNQDSASELHHETHHDVEMMQTMIQSLQAQIDLLTDQLRTKDRQIESLQQSLDQQQKLTALAQRKWWQKLLPSKQ